jgi:hypothetical protein
MILLVDVGVGMMMSDKGNSGYSYTQKSFMNEVREG